MAAVSENFYKHQKQEKILSALAVVAVVIAPILITALLQFRVSWIISFVIGAGILLCGFLINNLKMRVQKKLLQNYEQLNVGSVLEKKINSHNPSHFVITNTGYNHYYLKCLKSGEQVLVPKSRVPEDFNIAN